MTRPCAPSRYSVCSAVGVLPLALQYGFEECDAFLAGANDIDEHFRTAPFEENIPVLLGLTSVWNSTFLNYSSKAILPYCQALSKLAPHIQQVRPTSCSCPAPVLLCCSALLFCSALLLLCYPNAALSCRCAVQVLRRAYRHSQDARPVAGPCMTCCASRR